MSGFLFGILVGICIAVGQKSTVIVHGKSDILIVEYDHKLYKLEQMDGDK